jgi:hypothetical protein
LKGKRYRKQQDRNGSPSRRRMEFEVIRHHVKRNKAKFAARLEQMLEVSGDCLLHRGTRDHGGYPRINFRYKGQHFSIQVMRVFVILKTCAPIPLGYEAGHVGCPRRSCIRHVELLHYKYNASTNPRKVPF